jgi:hypothetical protein
MMKGGKPIILFCLILILSALGCSTHSPMTAHFRNNFDDFKMPEKDNIKKSAIKRTYPASAYDSIWDSALTIISQQSIIIKASKSSGIIGYVDIDSVFIKSFWVGKRVASVPARFLYLEFPFAVLIEKDTEVTTVYVYPMTEIFEFDKNLSDPPFLTSFPSKGWLDTVKTGFNQKGEEFLERLSVQLTAQNRWQWLSK